MFTESQDKHDYVFDMLDVRNSEMITWWNDNKALLSTLGKTDLADFKLGVLSDLRQGYLYGGVGGGLGFSHGSLQALGLTPVLVDGLEFEKGLGHALPVILDSSTAVMAPAMVDSVKRYVAEGGVFVTSVHAGRHTPSQRDAWPLAAAFGLKGDGTRVTGDNYHRWPSAKLRFTAEQTLLPSLRGQEAAGRGISIDWQDKRPRADVALTPLAHWEDGSMAIAEITHGKGRIIFVGTPFYTTFQYPVGRWLSDGQNRALLEEMLLSLGVKRETAVDDERLWFERRESKNGLYDVYFASFFGGFDRGQYFSGKVDEAAVDIELFLRGRAPSVAVEPTATGVPDLALRKTAEGASLGMQAFAPFQIRQFAVLRSDVGVKGPLHWLEAQRRHWRALEPVPASPADEVAAQAAAIAADYGEEGLDLTQGWRVKLDPAARPDDTAWLNENPAGPGWRDGLAGPSWLSQGWDAQRVLYRRKLDIPRTWLGGGSRVLLGLTAFGEHGVRSRGKLFLNGKAAEELAWTFRFDVTDAIRADGSLDIGFDIVGGEQRDLGMAGTLYLRRMPASTATLDLAGEWTEQLDWERMGGKITIPFAERRRVFGLYRRVTVPADWAGRPVRLVIEHSGGSGAHYAAHNAFNGVILNGYGYVAPGLDGWAPLGPRIDKWLRPGEENEIEIGYNKNALIRSIRLEAYPAVKREASYTPVE
jgi:hypothetical protein